MNNLFHKITTAIFAIIVFAFWLVGHPEALSFQEQYQMFLLTKGYFAERMAVAGGLADYVAEFLTQMYYFPALGAGILAIVITLIQISTWTLAKRTGGKGMPDTHYALSFIPAIMTLCLMGDENMMLEFAVATLMVLGATIGYTYVREYQWAVHLAAIPLLYWLAGPIVIIYIIATAIYDIRMRGTGKAVVGGIALGIVIWIATMTIAAMTWLVQYTPTDIAFGINYNRLRQVVPPMMIATEAATALIPLVIALMPQMKSTVVLTVEWVIIAIAGIAGVEASYDKAKYSTIEYDYLVRSERWDAIIEKAKKDRPQNDMDRVCINLALEMRGELLERMFEFNQNGAKGLLAPAKRDQLTCLSTAEVFYRLGMVNEAQKYFFDIQESIINCRKSSRCTKRIIETMIVNGRYEVARKYIDRLKNTMFYAGWAKNAEKYLYNEEAVNTHPIWGRMRQLRYKNDFLGNYYEMDKMLGMLYLTNTTNRMAFEYFVAQNLLLRNMKGVYSAIPWFIEQKYAQTPRHIEEAISMIWSQGHSSFDGMPIEVSQQTKNDLMRFAKIYSTNPKDRQLEQDNWKKTYWHYCLIEKPRENVDGKSGATSLNSDEEQKR
ncbi:MAG: DUF6057 family protein [Bacteroidales bacterium]|nr:DUF6057 family protein [Bacteroidales bacterium]